MPQSGIYAITNSLTGAVYVGSAADIKKRKREHLHALRHNKHHSPYLQRSFNQHGEAVFVWSVLEEVPPTKDLLFERETYWVQTLQPAYNASTVSASRLGAKLTPEQLERHLERMRDPETRKQISETLQGHGHSTETRAKISESLTGKKVSDSVKQNLLHHSLQRTTEERRLDQLGKKRTEETKRKIAEKASQRKHSEATKQKMREAKLGKKRSKYVTRKSVDAQEQKPQQHTLFE